MPKLAVFLFGIAMALFCIQPWSLQVLGMPLQVLLVWLVLPVLAISRPKQIANGLKAIGSVNLLLIVGVFIFVVYRTSVDNQDFLRVQQAATGGVIMLLGASIATDLKRLQLLVTVLMGVAGASGLVACLQAVGLADWTWSHTLYQGYPPSLQQPSGLELYPVAYSYSIVGFIVLGVALIFYNLSNKGARKFSFPNIWIAGSTILATLGLIASGSRSGLIGMFLGIIAFGFLIKREKIKSMNPFAIILVCALAFSLMLISSPELSGRLFNKLDETSSDARLSSNWQIFGPIILDNPLGVPYSDLEQGQPRLAGKAGISDAYRKMKGYDPHNFLLTISLFYGIPSGLFLTGIYIYSIISGAWTVLTHHRYCTLLHAFLACGFIAANLALLGHSWFHNASIFIGEMRNWFFLGGMLGSSFMMRYLRVRAIKEQYYALQKNGSTAQGSSL